MIEEMKDYTHDLLPLLTKPIAITNENAGGWLADCLQDKSESNKG